MAAALALSAAALAALAAYAAALVSHHRAHHGATAAVHSDAQDGARFRSASRPITAPLRGPPWQRSGRGAASDCLGR